MNQHEVNHILSFSLEELNEINSAFKEPFLTQEHIWSLIDKDKGSLTQEQLEKIAGWLNALVEGKPTNEQETLKAVKKETTVPFIEAPFDAVLGEKMKQLEPAMRHKDLKVYPEGNNLHQWALIHAHVFQLYKSFSDLADFLHSSKEADLPIVKQAVAESQKISDTYRAILQMIDTLIGLLRKNDLIEEGVTDQSQLSQSQLIEPFHIVSASIFAALQPTPDCPEDEQFGTSFTPTDKPH